MGLSVGTNIIGGALNVNILNTLSGVIMIYSKEAACSSEGDIVV